MPRVIHFEILADNPERAVKFYEKVFGWKIKKEGPIDYWLAETGEQGQPGINGAIMNRAYKTGTINTLDVPSVDDFAKKVVKAGGKIARAKTTIPGVGYFVYCTDTEGNLFGILQQDPKAH